MVYIPAPKQIVSLKDKVPTRAGICIMLFVATAVTYMVRVNLSVSLLAMVESTDQKVVTNETTYDGEELEVTELPDYGPRYAWSKAMQSYLLGAYFWGYLLTSLLGGYCAERFGGHIVVSIVLGLSSLLTAISPIAAKLSPWALFVDRLLIGVCGGFTYPSFHNIISRWAPPDEKGKFVAALMGAAFGTVITWPLTGTIVEHIGWEYSFYVQAIIVMIVVVVWVLTVSASPATHPRIKVEEKQYIEKSMGDNVSAKKGAMVPYLKLLTSIPFWALLILHYGNLWGLYFLITGAPKFMNEVLGFDIGKAGLLASMPYLLRMLFGFGFGSIGDYIRKKGWLSVTAIRKVFTIFSHIVPGLFLICLGFISQPYICVAMVSLSLGFNGASTQSNLQNSQDLAPNFAGSLYGIINFVGTTTGFLTPMVVAYFTESGNTLENWVFVFWIGGFAYIAPAILFVIFGTGLVQPWNTIPEKENNP